MSQILLVEDDVTSAEILARLLRTSGHSVTCAPDGGVAVSLLEESRPDVVLLDMMMPVLDGTQVLTRIRQTPRLSDLPVIMLTAVAHGPDADRVRSLGVEGYFVKGTIYFPHLLQRISELSAKNLA